MKLWLGFGIKQIVDSLSVFFFDYSYWAEH